MAEVIVRVDQERLQRDAVPLYASRIALMQRIWPRFSDQELATVASFFQATSQEAAVTEAPAEVMSSPES